MAQPQTVAHAARGLATLFKAGMSTGHEQMLIITKTIMPLMASPLLQQMGLGEGTTEPFALLDGACGSGVVTQEVQRTVPRAVLEGSSIVASDSSEALVDLVRTRVEAEGWVNTEAKVLDAMDTKLAENSFSHVALGLALHLIPKPDDVLKDCRRILKPGGIFGATTFNDSVEEKRFWQPVLRAAFKTFPFEAPFPDEIPMQTHTSGKWTSRDWVEEHLKSQEGFGNVEVRLVSGTYRLQSGDEFVTAFGMMISWVMNSWWSEEQRAAHPLEEVKELVKKYLDGKHGGKGWDISWENLVMTATVE
ncbi:unnamed protein product [Clonostachys chloroleuca]|uniref:Methyltransferase type 11 domain-containing protein n=1 Tax=Clonostachys chloroleuca TaxID=1926264 RepID=A0AA35M6N5_9HYPO|nr:unnamed protein product [Clonostachys chloroleuca]